MNVKKCWKEKKQSFYIKYLKEEMLIFDNASITVELKDEQRRIIKILKRCYNRTKSLFCFLYL